MPDYRENLNPEFKNYVVQNPNELEVVPWCLFDTVWLYHNTEKPLQFFVNTYKPIQSNQWIPGMLPNPMAMNIERIRIFGIASDLTLAMFKLTIGNKIMTERPCWTTAVKEGFHVRPAFFIPPYVAFRASIEWEGRIHLSGKQRVRPVQVCMFGKLARAVN